MRTRRFLLTTGLTTLAAGVARPLRATEAFEVRRPDAEWRRRLTGDQYAVLRKSGTERPYTSPLTNEHRAGTFACAGCDLPVFSSRAKFDSGTGWPSFWEPLAGAVGTETDRAFGMVRTACIAGAAAAIWATSSRTARPPRAYATA